MKRYISLFICVAMMSLFCFSASAEWRLAPWQTAYMNVLSEKRMERGPFVPGDERFESYSLYDVDKDGVPELFLRYGMSTASSKCYIYSFQGGIARFIDQFYFGSSQLYSYPQDNGVLLVYAHMYHAKGNLLTLNNGKLNESLCYEEDVNQSGGDWYTPVDHFCKGAVVVSEFRYDQDYPLNSYYSWVDSVFPIADDATYPNQDENYFFNAIIDNRTVVKVRYPYVGFSLDGVEIERIGLRDLLESLVQVSYDSSGEPDSGESKSFLIDLNDDGQLEYVISHYKDEGSFLGNQFMIILSEQNGTVYAYTDEISSFTDLDSSGHFYRCNNYFGMVEESAYRVYFDAENWTKIYCSLDDFSGHIAYQQEQHAIFK